MKRSNFDISELRQLEQNIQKLLDCDIDRICEEICTELGLRFEGKAKRKTPVDTGRLRQGWKITSVKRIGKLYEITVYNDVHYAVHVEYGHVTRNHANYVVGRFMMHQAEVEVEQLAPKLVRKRVKQLFREAFGG